MVERRIFGRLGVAASLVMFCSVVPAAQAAAPVINQWQGLVMLQPESVMQQRSPSADAVVDYLKRVQAASEQAVAALPATPSGGYLVLAVRPGGQARVWLDLEPALPLANAQALRAAVEAVRPFAATDGVLVFALGTTLWGGALLQRMPAPAQFKATADAAGHPLEIEALVDRLWPAAQPR